MCTLMNQPPRSQIVISLGPTLAYSSAACTISSGCCPRRAHPSSRRTSIAKVPDTSTLACRPRYPRA
eukprot:6181045-Pleurochrysis_carterae.AAC.3